MGKIYTALGLMSGTSMDGIDASIISSDGDREYSVIVDKYYKYDEKFRDDLVHIRSKILTNEDLTSFETEIETLERELTLLHANAANDIVKKNDLNIDFIGFHGHTLFHDSKKKISKQIGDGNLLSQLCKKDVIYNFRQVDIENGGEGAPLTPIFHNAIVNKNLNNEFNKFDSINILNIGGIANITKTARWDNFYKSTDMLQASDIGPGNCMIDSWIRNNSNSMFDNKGNIASYGKTDSLILNQALENLNILPPYNKSLDINDFDISFVRGLNLENGASTLSDLTAEIISNAIIHYSNSQNSLSVVCGGGRKNIYLMDMINKKLSNYNNLKFFPIENFGIDGDYIESQAFAYLAIRSFLNLPLSFPKTTRCKFTLFWRYFSFKLLI